MRAILWERISCTEQYTHNNNNKQRQTYGGQAVSGGPFAVEN
jgi:hypothetical protein